MVRSSASTPASTRSQTPPPGERVTCGCAPAEQLHLADGSASLIYGAYGSLVYITPVLGGYVADRWLGQRKAVLFGGMLLATFVAPIFVPLFFNLTARRRGRDQREGGGASPP